MRRCDALTVKNTVLSASHLSRPMGDEYAWLRARFVKYPELDVGHLAAGAEASVGAGDDGQGDYTGFVVSIKEFVYFCTVHVNRHTLVIN